MLVVDEIQESKKEHVDQVNPSGSNPSSDTVDRTGNSDSLSQSDTVHRPEHTLSDLDPVPFFDGRCSYASGQVVQS